MGINRTVIFLAILFSAIFAMAEECYYYCGSEKITIFKDPAHAMIVTPADSPYNLKEIPAVRVIRHISDDTYRMTVIEKKGSVSFSDIMKMMPERSADMFVTSCYMDEYGVLEIPTGLIYVELKSESDFPLLQQAADKHCCRILRQNEFRPLWYTLQVTQDSDGDCVEVANKMYESGLFSCTEPSFAFNACI